MVGSNNIGDYGEQVVARYLQSEKGHHLFGVNYHSKYGEVDIISMDGSDIVFVEVKTRKKSPQVTGFEAVTKEKQIKIIKTAMKYLEENDLEMQPRFDVAVMTYNDDNTYEIDYIEAAFDASVVNL